MFKPFEGIKVIDCTLAGSGPSCTKLLAEYGADVIWIEPLKGVSTRTVHKFDFYTTGKRSIALNLKTSMGQDVLHRLITNADIFVTNYRPQALTKLQIDYPSLKEINPTLIYGSINGFGEYGPEAEHPGYDPVAFWSKGGLLQDIAEKDSLVVPPISVGDITAGTVLAGGISTAMVRRLRTGEGCYLTTSLYGTAVYLNHDAAIEVQYGETYPKSRKAPRRALLNTYKCKDDKWITITIIDNFDRYFNALLKALHLSHLIGDSRWTCIEDTMYAHAPELVAILDGAFLALTQKEAIAILKAIDIPVCPVQSTKELLHDPQSIANHYYYPLPATTPPTDDTEQILVPCSPVKFENIKSGTNHFQKGPCLGEHSREILMECGYNNHEIEQLLQSHIVIQH